MIPPPTTARSQRSGAGGARWPRASARAQASASRLTAPGPARGGRRGRVEQARAVQAFVAPAAELARGRTQARRDLRGRRVAAEHAAGDDSAAVAATCGAAIEVPS